MKKFSKLNLSVLIIGIFSAEIYAGTLYWYVDEEGVTHFGPTPNLNGSASSGELEYDDIVDPPATADTMMMTVITTTVDTMMMTVITTTADTMIMTVITTTADTMMMTVITITVVIMMMTVITITVVIMIMTAITLVVSRMITIQMQNSIIVVMKQYILTILH